jgi:glycosyltransferase involved in cell wall biosynthesis
MATQLIKLLNNDVLRKEMSSAARQKALQYDWKIIAAKMKEIYQGLF